MRRQLIISAALFLELAFSFAVLLHPANAASTNARKEQPSNSQEQQIESLMKQVRAVYQPMETLRLTVEDVSRASNQPDKIEKSQTEIVYRRPNLWRVTKTVQGESQPESIFVADGSDAFLSVSGTLDRKPREYYDGAVVVQVGLLWSLVSKFDISEDEPNDPNVQTEYLPPRLIEGERLEGIRVRSRSKPVDNLIEDTYWFDTKTHFWRRQQSMHFISVAGHKERSVTTSRVVKQEINGEIPTDTFVPPPPFQSDLEKPKAFDFLQRAF